MSTYSLPVALEVPPDAKAGTYWSLLFLQPVDPARIEQQEQSDRVRTTVTVNVRFGVTFITHVGQPTDPNLLFHDPALVRDAETGVATIGLTIENPTPFLISGDAWLELYDQEGGLVHQSARKELRVYPEARRNHSFELGTLEDQDYQAVIIADAGDDAVFGVRYDLEVGAD